MRVLNSLSRLLIATLVFAVIAGVYCPSVSGQDDTWLVIRAQYGYKDQQKDVTDLVGDLIQGGGVNGRVAVNNQTMGGDPAPEKHKVLRIFARNRNNQEHEFDIKEGGSFEARMFSVPPPPPPSDSWNGRDRYADRGDRDDQGGIRIVRGFYGVQGRTANVTDLLRSMVHNGMLTVIVGNRSMGQDPAVGEDKVLIVIYAYQGREQAVAVREGGTLSIP